MFKGLRKRLRGYKPEPLIQANDIAPESKRLALVLSGGGARSAYQAGVLKFIAKELPNLRIDINTGVSAGAINTIQLANHTGNFGEKVEELTRIWKDVSNEKVYESEDTLHLAWRILKGKIGKHDEGDVSAFKSLVSTDPLQNFLMRHLQTKDGTLPGIAENLLKEKMDAVAVTATNYTTNQNITFVQGGYDYSWTRPHRRSVHTNLTVDHLMASAALPLLFPAIRIGNDWYGDGGVRLAAPLSPALRLGADKILTISNRYNKTQIEGDTPQIHGYPPSAQIMGVIMSSIFLDLLERDATTLKRINHLIDALPAHLQSNYRHVDLFIIRPSIDLSEICGKCDDPNISGSFGTLIKRIGGGQSKTPEWMSMVVFEQEYVEQLLETGEKDAEAQADELLPFLENQCDKESTKEETLVSEKV